jgi:hypothetical protein
LVRKKKATFLSYNKIYYFDIKINNNIMTSRLLISSLSSRCVTTKTSAVAVAIGKKQLQQNLFHTSVIVNGGGGGSSHPLPPFARNQAHTKSVRFIPFIIFFPVI